MGFTYLTKKIGANRQSETMYVVIRVNLNGPKKLTHASYREYVLKYLEGHSRLDNHTDLGGDPRQAIIKRKHKVTSSILF